MRIMHGIAMGYWTKYDDLQMYARLRVTDKKLGSIVLKVPESVPNLIRIGEGKYQNFEQLHEKFYVPPAGLKFDQNHLVFSYCELVETSTRFTEPKHTKIDVNLIEHDVSYFLVHSYVPGPTNPALEGLSAKLKNIYDSNKHQSSIFHAVLGQAVKNANFRPPYKTVIFKHDEITSENTQVRSLVCDNNNQKFALIFAESIDHDDQSENLIDISMSTVGLPSMLRKTKRDQIGTIIMIHTKGSKISNNVDENIWQKINAENFLTGPKINHNDDDVRVYLLKTDVYAELGVQERQKIFNKGTSSPLVPINYQPYHKILSSPARAAFLKNILAALHDMKSSPKSGQEIAVFLAEILRAEKIEVSTNGQAKGKVWFKTDTFLYEMSFLVTEVDKQGKDESNLMGIPDLVATSVKKYSFFISRDEKLKLTQVIMCPKK